jgi:hypothetical protein
MNKFLQKRTDDDALFQLRESPYEEEEEEDEDEDDKEDDEEDEDVDGDGYSE